jgi:hypothetical protein
MIAKPSKYRSMRDQFRKLNSNLNRAGLQTERVSDIIKGINFQQKVLARKNLVEAEHAIKRASEWIFAAHARYERAKGVEQIQASERALVKSDLASVQRRLMAADESLQEKMNEIFGKRVEFNEYLQTRKLVYRDALNLHMDVLNLKMNHAESKLRKALATVANSEASREDLSQAAATVNNARRWINSAEKGYELMKSGNSPIPRSDMRLAELKFSDAGARIMLLKTKLQSTDALLKAR